MRHDCIILVWSRYRNEIQRNSSQDGLIRKYTDNTLIDWKCWRDIRVNSSVLESWRIQKSLGYQMTLSQVTLSRDIYQAFIFRTLFEKSKRCKDSLGVAVPLSSSSRPYRGTLRLRSQTTAFATDGVVYTEWGSNVCALAEPSHLHNAVGTAWLPMRRAVARMRRSKIALREKVKRQGRHEE